MFIDSNEAALFTSSASAAACAAADPSTGIPSTRATPLNADANPGSSIFTHTPFRSSLGAMGVLRAAVAAAAISAEGMRRKEGVAGDGGGGIEVDVEAAASAATAARATCSSTFPRLDVFVGVGGGVDVGEGLAVVEDVFAVSESELLPLGVMTSSL